MVVCAEHKVNCDRGGETMQSMLIKDTTRAQREEIVRRGLAACSDGCDGCSSCGNLGGGRDRKSVV